MNVGRERKGSYLLVIESIHSITKIDGLVQESANYAGRSIQLLPIFANKNSHSYLSVATFVLQW